MPSTLRRRCGDFSMTSNTAERRHQALGEVQADAFDQAGGEVALDAFAGRRRRDGEEMRAELHAVFAVLRLPAAMFFEAETPLWGEKERFTNERNRSPSSNRDDKDDRAEMAMRSAASATNEERQMLLQYARVLLVASAAFLCAANPAPAKNLDKGWWVIVASFPTEPYQRMQSDSEAVRAAAARCGVKTFNDFSGKFRGFAPGYNVFVLGAYPSKTHANDIANAVRRCFEGAYVKYGEYLGE